MKSAGISSLLTPRVFGFSKKQNTDPLLPANTCVIFDTHLYNKLMDYCFEDCENPDLSYLMHGLKLYFMRNPCLWMTMFRELRVWNRDDFANHLATEHGILLDNYLCSERNKDVILIDPESVVFFSHGDVDGDLSPLFCFKQLPDRPKFVPMVPSQEELKWNKIYFEEEFEADDVMNKPMVYKLYETKNVGTLVKRKRVLGYVDFLVNARAAKNAIGPGTNDGWVFTMLVELYREARKQNKGAYQINKHTINMINITDDDFKVLTFSYVRGLQDFVITGVKHNDNGSAGFDLLYLRNFSKLENQKALSSIFIKDLHLNPEQVAKMFAVVNWATESGVLDAAKAFLRLYNKGVYPTKPETVEFLKQHSLFIQQNTYFGSLIKSIFDITVKIESHNKAILDNIQNNQIDFNNL